MAIPVDAAQDTRILPGAQARMYVAHQGGVTTMKKLFGTSTIVTSTYSQMSVLLTVFEYESVNKFIEMIKAFIVSK